MVVKTGDKLHVIIRRSLPEDVRRHFVGFVVGATDQTVRLEGYAFVLEPNTGVFTRRPERRTRVLSLTDAQNLIHVIPASVDLESLEYRMSRKKRLVVTDGQEFQLDINEFGSSR